MQLTVIGTGYVGLVSGVCFSTLGIKTVCVDINEEKIEKLKQGVIPIYEPGLEDLLKQNNLIHFSTNLEAAMQNADVIMIAVGTPENKNCPQGSADLSYIYQAAKDIALYLKPYQVIVTKSTVPVGTGKKIADIISKIRLDLKIGIDFDVASNPEFLREGSAIDDFMKPDRIVIGVENQKAKDVLLKLYQPLIKKGFPLFDTNITSAELIKYAANGFLAMKIAFANQISDLCEKIDARVDDVVYGIGLDKRINPYFLNPGPGYGGSCFPKDTKALTDVARHADYSLTIIDAVIAANEKRKNELADRLLSYLKKHKKKRLSILGITFKANTDDLREASSLTIIPKLIENGIEVVVYDPIYNAENPCPSLFQNVKWAASIEEAVNDSDGLCILTEWDEFKHLNTDELRKKMSEKKPLFADFRNLYTQRKPKQFDYMCLGYKDNFI